MAIMNVAVLTSFVSEVCKLCRQRMSAGGCKISNVEKGLGLELSFVHCMSKATPRSRSSVDLEVRLAFPKDVRGSSKEKESPQLLDPSSRLEETFLEKELFCHANISSLSNTT